MQQDQPLYIVLRKEFFDDIKTGKKKYEYRDNSKYWAARLSGKTYKTILFQRGYHAGAARLLVEFKKCTEYSDHFEIKIGKIIKFTKAKK